MKNIAKLHYITQETANLNHLDSVRLACEAGCKWIQLRVKNTTVEQYIQLAKAAKEICQAYGALLCINDNPAVALASNADALHLGKQDMPLPEARKILGENILIGGTANEWADLKKLSDWKADYIGLGPFRFTTTKAKLSPVLGLEGYTKLCTQMKKEGIKIPVLAIGGIQLEDVEALLTTGIHGIACSGLITKAEAPKKTVEQLAKVLG
jgi:thiamine-phosphate pyrophosphorylase